MRRSLEIRVLLFCATCLSGGGLAAAELQKLPVAGETFSGRIELKESQEFIEHWSRETRFSRRFELGAEITWKVLQSRERSVVLEGRITEGLYRHALAGFIELEEVYGLILDSLVFQLRLAGRESRLQVDRKSLQRVVNRFEKGQANRRLPEGIRKQIVAALLDRLQLAHLGGFWPVFNGSMKGLERVDFFSRRLASRGENSSGALFFSVYPSSTRSFAKGKGRELLLRRSHAALGAGGAVSAGYGSYAWVAGGPGPPYRCQLKLVGDYVDLEELKAVVDFPGEYRQRHSLEFFLGSTEEKTPSGTMFTGLPPRLELPEVSLDLLTAAERRELSRLKRKASESHDALLEVLSGYARMERGADAGQPLCAALHFALCERLASELPAERGPLGDYTERVVSRGRLLAEYILVLRAVASPLAGFTDARRLEFFRAALSRRETRFARWGGMLLAQGNWKGTVDLLLATLARQAAVGGREPLSRLGRSLELDLQRLSGRPVAGLDAGKIRSMIEQRAARSAQRRFSLVLPGENGKGVFFTEAGAGAVFLFDASRPFERSSVTRKRGTRLPLTERTRLAYLALGRSLEKPPPGLRFALGRFHSGALLRSGWAPGSTPDWLKETLDFVAAELPTGSNPRDVSRARYEVGFKAALSGFPDAESVVLSTDFDRGDYWQAESRLLVWNYIRGARVITYGLKEDREADPAVLSFLERLAWNHHGWFRFLD